MESPLDPASIHNPTVEVEAPGIVSVETLNPFDKTEVLVTGSAYFLEDPETGVARVLARVWRILANHLLGICPSIFLMHGGILTYGLP
jgi:hypothetical protein